MGSKFALAYWRLYAVAAVLVASAVVASAMSIEAEPVKVTHRNSGPRYDIDEVERNRLASANQERAPSGPPQPSDRPRMEAPSEAGSEEGAAPIGHVAIRRIFLFPMMRPGDWSQQDQPEGARETPSQQQPGRGEQDNEHEHEPMPSMFAKPFWPFMTPARPSPASHQEHERPHRPHLFGSDEASRSPSGDQDKAASGPERVDQALPQQPPMFDPIQMMMDLMHQAISSQLPPNFTTDLNNNNKDKEPNSNSNNNDNAPAESSDERPQMPSTDLIRSSAMPPSAKNESRVDIVEIEGKKYLRKVVTNRHVGENIIFMTRRLIFVPLNETDSTTNTTTTDTVATTSADPAAATTTDSPPTTTAPVSGGEREATAVAADDKDRVGTNKPVTTSEPTPSPSSSATEQAVTTSQAATPSTVSPTTTAPSSEQPTSSESSVEATTMPKASPVERDTEPTAKASERLVEEAVGKPTQAPANVGAEKPAEGA